jgi:hypothetical protein
MCEEAVVYFSNLQEIMLATFGACVAQNVMN